MSAPDQLGAFTALGFRRCYRSPTTFHGVSNISCDCLRTELPVEAQAKSSGRLGTPDRNHDCQYCDGIGLQGYDAAPGIRELTGACCWFCLGAGELTASGQRLAHYHPSFTDRELRSRVSAARAAGKIGRRP